MALVQQDNKQFAEKVKNMCTILGPASTFAYDCYGEIVDYELIGKLFINNLVRYDWDYTKLLELGTEIGKRAYDPTSIIKIPLNALNNKTIHDYYNEAEEKYFIEDMPEIVGLAVYYKDHIGIYIGHGDVVEVSGALGITKTKLHEGPWQIAFKIKDINY